MSLRLNVGMLPDRIMIMVHPQRWSDSFLPWAKELFWQNVKNQVKKYVVLRSQGSEFSVRKGW